MAFSPFRVDFDFTSAEKASMVVVAETEEAAAEGALQLINTLPGYDNAKITSVSAENGPQKPTVN